MYSENPNYFELRDAFDEYYKVHPFEKNSYTQYFKRLMKENWAFVDENGFVQRPVYNPVEEAQYLEKKRQNEQMKSSNSQWNEIGPWQYDHEQAMAFEVQSPGSAHVYTVEQSLTDDQLVYVGTATAGVWKSTNKGQLWTLVTKNIMVGGVYSVAIDPQNNDIVYFGEENGTIWKTVNGGLDWTKTGSVSFQNSAKWVRDLKIIGVNTLLAATNTGLFRSNDGGINWVSISAGEFMEIEINPANSQILYTVKLNGSKTEFYKSLDNGLTWTIKTNGWPLPLAGDEQKRTEISVSEANPNMVFVWCAGAVGPDEGFYGLYKSTDAGESFTFECCGAGPGGTATVDDPNMLGYSGEGTENGGQYYYDLAFCASPTDVNRLYGAGINVWRSDDSGANWELNAHWVTWVGDHTPYRYTHADVHDIKFFKHGSTVDMWVCSDGGVFYSQDQGDTIVPRMHGIHGTDFWGYQAGFKQGDVMLGGTYHNGTLIKYKDIYHGGLTTPNANGWLAERGGDNMRGFVNYGNSKIGYDDGGSFEFSEIRSERKTSRSFDGNNKCNTSYIGGEYGNYGFSPNNYNEFYSPVGTKLMKTTNGGVSFEEVYDFGGSKVIQVKVAWSNPSYIYVTHKPSTGSTKLMKSTDGGLSWTDVTVTSTVAGSYANKAKYVEVDEEDPNKIWCILFGSHTGKKVFQSIDGGLTWTDITGPAINTESVLSIFHQYGSNDGLYIGTKRAVYYKNATMTDWVLFNNNLPAKTACLFLEPFYAGGKLRTATERSVFECDFFEDVPPVAMIAADKDSINIGAKCIADTIQFVDHSTVRTASANWLWTFEGGTPSSSTLENPKVVYDQPGTYYVKLVVSDQFGIDSITIPNFIKVVNNIISNDIHEDFENADFPPIGWKLFDSEGSSWEQDWPDGDPSDKCASFPNYWEDATSQQHYLILPALSFENAIDPSITFDVSYHDNGSYTDSLAVIYRTGSNPVWQQIWIKGGQDLTVAGTDVWFWYNTDPTLVWRTETLDLSFLIGESCVELAFSNLGTYGNHIWIDNVNLDSEYTGIVETSNLTGVSVVPNPSNGKFEIKTLEVIPLSYEVHSISGQKILSGDQKTIDLSNEASGIYILKIKSNSFVKTVKLIKE